MALAFLDRTQQAYYRAVERTRAAVQTEVDRLWRQVVPGDIDGSWQQVRQQVAATVAGGQARAASAAPLLLDRVLAADGLSPSPDGAVSPLAFAGWTADGSTVQDVVDAATIYAKLGISKGLPAVDALIAAQRQLDLIAGTEVADAGRGALDAGIRLEPQIVGWERYVHTPCCSRCAILAGRFYKKSDGFLRHPGCLCCHRPVTSKDHKPDQTPMDLFHAMSDAEQDAAFTRDGARAIRDGADINQIVNARWSGGVRGKSAGMSRPGDPYTTAGTGKRTVYGAQERAAGRRKPNRRLSPQGVAVQAGADTKLYRQLLRDNGYIKLGAT